MKTLILLTLFLSPIITSAQAQFVAFESEDSSLEITQANETILLSFTVEKNYYIQADEAQIQDEFLIPTRLSIEPVEGIRVCQAIFGKPQTNKVFGKGVIISVLDGTFNIEVEVETGLDLGSGVVPLKGKLFYQASDDMRCFPPKELAFEASLEIITP